MFNYKRLTFLLLFITVFLLATDTQAERQLRKSLLSFFDIVVEESTQVSDSAPSSFIETCENARLAIYGFLDQSADQLEARSLKNKGIISMLLTLAAYIVLIFKFIASFVITFYPSVILLLFLFFTSKFFKRDDFGSGNFNY
jgi:hypothetical protein